MSLLGKGVLAIWNGIDPEHEEEFLAWHVHEHIPDRVALPGFLRGRRYVALDGTPKYFNFYETGSVADLDSPAYRHSLDTPSSWTRAVIRHFSHTSRTICRVASTLGRGEGAVIETLRLGTPLPSPEFRQGLAGMLDEAAREPGVVGVHLLEGLSERHPPRETAEMRLRGGPDETVDWIILVDAVHAGVLKRLLQAPLNERNLTNAGAEPGIRRGTYALQFSLAKPDMENTQSAGN
jgi:hypothetical protein